MKILYKTKAVLALILVAAMLALSACTPELLPAAPDYPSPGITEETDPYTPEDDFDFPQPSVFVNGELLPGAFTMSLDLENPYFPTHIALMAVLYALDTPVTWRENQVIVEGPSGTITINQGSYEYIVNGETITLPGLPAVAVHGTVYVPIRFFRDVFGMNNAYFSGGEVHINNDERME